MRHLIIGNGAAGITAAEKLRELSQTDEITIITKEEVTAYTKPMLPDYIAGRIQRDKLFIRDNNNYKVNRINLVTGENVIRFKLNEKSVVLKSGREIDYDKLLIAAGGIPFIPFIEVLAHTDYYTINSIIDADRIKSKAVEGDRALIVGAGLTGIEIGFALNKLGMKVTIIEREEIILPMLLDVFSSNILVERMRKEGIELILGTTLNKISENDEKCAELSNEQKIKFDMLAITIGTRPDISLIKDTGLKYRRGVLVNEFMKTSFDDVYAAGDVAEMVNPVSNEYTCSYIWPNAMAQGRCAALSMAGQPQGFSTTTSTQNMVQLRDIPFMSMGLINPKSEEYESRVSFEKDKGIYQKLVLKDNKIKGIILLGDTKSGNLLCSLIRKGENVSAFKDILFDKDFNEKYKKLVKENF